MLDCEGFLGPLQHWALSQKLRWKRPIAFDPADESHESALVPANVDIEKTLEEWAGVLRANKKPLIAALKHFNELEGDEDVVEVSISTDASWALPESGYAALVEWLNAPLSGKAKGKKAAKATKVVFDLEALRAGTFDKFGEYSPAPATKAALDALPKGDSERVMAAYALGHALLEKTPLALFQPDDDMQHHVWESDGEG